jgi:hypothetical protein
MAPQLAGYGVQIGTDPVDGVSKLIVGKSLAQRPRTEFLQIPPRIAERVSSTYHVAIAPARWNCAEMDFDRLYARAQEG